MKQKLLWLCTGENPDCKKTNCFLAGGFCDHTTDEKYARDGDHYFIQAADGSLWEEDK